MGSIMFSAIWEPNGYNLMTFLLGHQPISLGFHQSQSVSDNGDLDQDMFLVPLRDLMQKKLRNNVELMSDRI